MIGKRNGDSSPPYLRVRTESSRHGDKHGNRTKISIVVFWNSVWFFCISCCDAFYSNKYCIFKEKILEN